MISQRFCFYKNSFSEKADAEDGWRTDDTDLWKDKDLIAFKNILLTSLMYICRIIGWKHIFAYIISSSSNLASFILVRNLCSNSEYNQNILQSSPSNIICNLQWHQLTAVDNNPGPRYSHFTKQLKFIHVHIWNFKPAEQKLNDGQEWYESISREKVKYLSCLAAPVKWFWARIYNWKFCQILYMVWFVFNVWSLKTAGQQNY